MQPPSRTGKCFNQSSCFRHELLLGLLGIIKRGEYTLSSTSRMQFRAVEPNTNAYTAKDRHDSSPLGFDTAGRDEEMTDASRIDRRPSVDILNKKNSQVLALSFSFNHVCVRFTLCLLL